MSVHSQYRTGTKDGKDQSNRTTNKSDRDSHSGQSVNAQSGRRQEGKDGTWNEKNRNQEIQIKSAEFRAAKKLEEDALMAALGIKIMPHAATPSVTTRTSVSVKDEPMTPAIHSDSRKLKQKHQHEKRDSRRKEDRRRHRQIKAYGSDEEKQGWSEDDEEDLMDEHYDDEKKTQSIEPDKMTEKEFDEFLVDLVKKHGIKKIQRTLKMKKEKKSHKRKRSSSASSSSSDSNSEHKKSKLKHDNKKKHSHNDDSKSKKHRRTRSRST